MFAEEHVAERIRRTREARKWSMEGLAKRMTDAGCPIAPSAIHKIENAGRRITVDELVALSRVFGISMSELVSDPDVHPASEIASRVKEFEENLRDYRAEVKELESTISATQKALTDIILELRELDAPANMISNLYRSLEGDERIRFGEAFLPDSTHNDNNSKSTK